MEGNQKEVRTSQKLLHTLRVGTPGISNVVLCGCKLMTLTFPDNASIELTSLSFTKQEENHAICEYSAPQKYLYEPGPAFLKSGAFKLIAERYNLKKLHPHTHLYTNDTPCESFPGKIFEIIEVCDAKTKAFAKFY